MTGIGEVSAIITVAQLGISLSTTLISFVGDVKDAGAHIQRVADEIGSTSDRLKELAELVQQNPSTKLFSKEGLERTDRLATRFRAVIDEIRHALNKADVQVDPDKVTGIEIDVSFISKCYWTFIQKQLEVPRAELGRLKIDLLLLYESVKLAGAKTKDEQFKYAKSIPGLERSRKWAARQYAEAQRRRRSRQEGETMQRSQSRESGPYWIDEGDVMEDEDHLREFLAFQEQRFVEQEERLELAEQALKEKEENKKAEEENLKRKKIEEEAIAKWQKEQKQAHRKEEEERQKKNALLTERLRKELERLKLPAEQVEDFLAHAVEEEVSKVDYAGLGQDGYNSSQNGSISSSIQGTKNKGFKLRSLFRRRDSLSREYGKRDSEKSIRSFRSRFSSKASAKTTANSSSSLLNSGFLGSKTPWNSAVLEAWSLEPPFAPRTRIPLPDVLLAKIVEEAERSHQTKLLQRFALLHPGHKSQIHQLIDEKNALETESQWVLVFLTTMETKRSSGMLNHVIKNVCIQVILEKLPLKGTSSGYLSSGGSPPSQPVPKSSYVGLSTEPAQSLEADTRVNAHISSTADGRPTSGGDGPAGDVSENLPPSWGLNVGGTKNPPTGNQQPANLNQQNNHHSQRRVNFDLPERKNSYGNFEEFPQYPDRQGYLKVARDKYGPPNDVNHHRQNISDWSRADFDRPVREHSRSVYEEPPSHTHRQNSRKDSYNKPSPLNPPNFPKDSLGQYSPPYHQNSYTIGRHQSRPWMPSYDSDELRFPGPPPMARPSDRSIHWFDRDETRFGRPFEHPSPHLGSIYPEPRRPPGIISLDWEDDNYGASRSSRRSAMKPIFVNHEHGNNKRSASIADRRRSVYSSNDSTRHAPRPSFHPAARSTSLKDVVVPPVGEFRPRGLDNRASSSNRNKHVVEDPTPNESDTEVINRYLTQYTSVHHLPAAAVSPEMKENQEAQTVTEPNSGGDTTEPKRHDEDDAEPSSLSDDEHTHPIITASSSSTQALPTRTPTPPRPPPPPPQTAESTVPMEDDDEDKNDDVEWNEWGSFQITKRKKRPKPAQETNESQSPP